MGMPLAATSGSACRMQRGAASVATAEYGAAVVAAASWGHAADCHSSPGTPTLSRKAAGGSATRQGPLGRPGCWRRPEARECPGLTAGKISSLSIHFTVLAAHTGPKTTHFVRSSQLAVLDTRSRTLPKLVYSRSTRTNCCSTFMTEQTTKMLSQVIIHGTVDKSMLVIFLNTCACRAAAHVLRRA
jgi:hypothetical protein